MAGLGFVGAGGAAGMTDALEKIVAQRLLEKKLEEARQQQEFENRMSLRAADTGDARFDRTQGHTEAMGEGNLELNQGQLGLSRERFGHEQGQDFRGNRIEDEDRGIAAGDRADRLQFFTELEQEHAADPIKRNIVRGLRRNVTLPDFRSPEQRGTEAGVEQGAAWKSGGRGVQQDSVNMQVAGNIRSSNAAADRRQQTASADPAAAEAADTASEVRRIAKALREHKGLSGAFGVASARMPTMRQGTADAEALLGSLQGLLTLENMGKMKGVLSDSDMKILRQASTTLNASMSEEAAIKELQRLELLGSGQSGESNTAAERAAALIKKYGGGD